MNIFIEQQGFTNWPSFPKEEELDKHAQRSKESKEAWWKDIEIRDKKRKVKVGKRKKGNMIAQLKKGEEGNRKRGEEKM